jgi:2-desacetyl-2-hydroxyethyl bacteriochlorophyllide A dehydrogenase
MLYGLRPTTRGVSAREAERALPGADPSNLIWVTPAKGDHVQAIRFRAAHQPLTVDDIPRPAVPAGHVLLDVEAAGVCGTELHFLEGLLTPATTPIVLGHEVAGRVAALGPGVTGWSEGDAVAVHYFHACRRCRPCRTGYEHLCDLPEGFLAFVTDGGFAEQVAVPASALAAVPPGLSATEAAPLCCGAATALHALSVAELRIGDTAVVYGCGGVGLALVQVLRLAGVRVLAVSRSAAKRDAAVQLGADVAVDASQGGVAEQVREATGGRGVDAVFELVGRAATMTESLAALAKRGRLVIVGYSFDALEVSPLSLVVPEVSIRTSVGNTHAELIDVLRLAETGELRTIVHETAPLADAERVLGDLADGRVVGRSVLLP